MSLRFLKLGWGAVFLISLASLGAILLFINPYRAGVFMLILFSVVLFMFFFSVFSWLGFWLRERFVTTRNLNRILKMVLREGALLAILITVYLWLGHFRFFKFWTFLATLVVVIGLEYYFLVFHGRTGQNQG